MNGRNVSIPTNEVDRNERTNAATENTVSSVIGDDIDENEDYLHWKYCAECYGDDIDESEYYLHLSPIWIKNGNGCCK